MFGWGKKRDGFEWHDYVRTTILVRRAKRRQKLDDVRQAAADGLKDAGVAAARGLNEAGHVAAEGLRNAGLKGQALGASGAAGMAAGLRRFGAASARISRAAGAKTVQLAGKVPPMAATVLAPLLMRLSDRRTRIALAAFGLAALIAAGYRALSFGIDSRAVFAALLSLFTLGPALLAERHRAELTTRPAAPQGGSQSPAPAPPSLSFMTGVLGWAAAAVLAVLGIGSLIKPEQAPEPGAVTTAALPDRTSAAPSGTIKGQARAISGDTLRIGRQQIRLAYIEAPDREQTCKQSNGRSWRCGEAAQNALTRLLKGGKVVCTVSTPNSERAAVGECRNDEGDIAAALVKGGHVFTETGFFARYSDLEKEARTKAAGLWVGEAERPAAFRAAIWNEARKKSPGECPIKGSVSSRGKIYVMPWNRDYDRVSVNTARGGRWFCSEEEATGAGWHPSNDT